MNKHGEKRFSDERTQRKDFFGGPCIPVQSRYVGNVRSGGHRANARRESRWLPRLSFSRRRRLRVTKTFFEKILSGENRHDRTARGAARNTIHAQTPASAHGFAEQTAGRSACATRIRRPTKNAIRPTPFVRPPRRNPCRRRESAFSTGFRKSNLFS
jgi:hypothetical protein